MIAERMIPTRVGVLLGSFDPLHRAHAWMVDYLHQRLGAAAMLIPAQHVHKAIRYPENAHLRQRLCMLARHRQRTGGTLYVGLTQAVLFIDLARALRQRLPGAEIWFGMGQGTYLQLLRSERYFLRIGRVWGAQERQLLARLSRRVIVFRRGPRAMAGIPTVALPPELREISSTHVRTTAASLWEANAAGRIWRVRLGARVPSGVLGWIRRNGLYRGLMTRSSRARGSSR